MLAIVLLLLAAICFGIAAFTPPRAVMPGWLGLFLLDLALLAERVAPRLR